MDWKKTLETLAPTVASALGGPLAGIAVSAIGSALGIDSATEDKISAAFQAGQITPDQLAALKSKEMDFQAHESEMQFKYADLEYQDIQDARDLKKKTGTMMPEYLTVVMILASLIMAFLTLSGNISTAPALAGQIGIVTGYLLNEAKQCVSYWVGTSRASERQSEIIAKAGPVNDE